MIENPAHKQYAIRFDVVRQRPPLKPAKYTPRIGVGDLLRYNAGVPRTIALSYLGRLVDLNGDGKRDLVGCWNYAYRPGWILGRGDLLSACRQQRPVRISAI